MVIHPMDKSAIKKSSSSEDEVEAVDEVWLMTKKVDSFMSLVFLCKKNKVRQSKHKHKESSFIW